MDRLKMSQLIALILVAAALVGIAPSAQAAGEPQTPVYAESNLRDATVYRPGCPFEECRTW